MLKVAFDVTGVIQGRFADISKRLIEVLHAQGCEVYVLSPNDMGTIQRDLGIAGIDPSWIKEIINRGDKGRVCVEYGIDLFIDDDPGYIRQSLSESPATMSLWRAEPGDVAKRFVQP